MTLQQFEDKIGYALYTQVSSITSDRLRLYVFDEYVCEITRDQYEKQDLSADLLHSILCRVYARGYSDSMSEKVSQLEMVIAYV